MDYLGLKLKSTEIMISLIDEIKLHGKLGPFEEQYIHKVDLHYVDHSTLYKAFPVLFFLKKRKNNTISKNLICHLKRYYTHFHPNIVFVEK